MNIVGNQVTLQAITDVGCLVTQLDGTTGKMPTQPVQLLQQALQCRSAFKINNFTGFLVECCTVVLGIIDIKADVD
jgi:hypothetical protein